MSEEKRMLEYMDKLGKDELKILESFSVVLWNMRHNSALPNLQRPAR